MSRTFKIVLFVINFTIVNLTIVTTSANAADKTLARKHFKSGLSLLKAENFDSAVIELNKSIELYPTKSAYYNLANCYRALHMYQDALKIFNILLTEYANELVREMRRDITRQIDEINNMVARFTITTNLPGATVALNGKEVNKTPLSAPLILAPDNYTITISLAGYDTIEHRVTVTSGTTPSVHFDLKESDSQLTIVSNEEGATLSIDGHEKGTTPFNAPLTVAPGTYRVEVKKEGYQTAEQTVKVEKGKNSSLTFNLLPQTDSHPSTSPGNETQPTDDKKKGGLSPLFWAGIAGTVVFGAATGATWGVAISKGNKHDTKVDDYNSWNSPEADADIRSAKQKDITDLKSTSQTFNKVAVGMTIAAGVSIVLTAAGVFLKRSREKRDNESKVSVRPALNGLCFTF